MDAQYIVLGAFEVIKGKKLPFFHACALLCVGDITYIVLLQCNK